MNHVYRIVRHDFVKMLIWNKDFVNMLILKI